jgi:hypothetical protein
MGIWSNLLVGGLAVAAAKMLISDNAEEKRRKSTPCYFTDGISQSEFSLMAK